MSLSSWFYNALGELSPEQLQAEYNSTYDQVIKAGGTPDQAAAAAKQATSGQVTDYTGSYFSAAGAAIENPGYSATLAAGAASDAFDSVTTKLGNLTANLISGKVLVAGIIIAVILFFWKK
ncbi:MAG: hypothetical protein KGJ13_06145 [Patescibacteria group bacterium]|nr:hypothetical protein [Patescibacteria group bacterium]